MAHKTLVGGTAYEITGGKALVDGTAYSIKNGKTLVGGTIYDLTFLYKVEFTNWVPIPLTFAGGVMVGDYRFPNDIPPDDNVLSGESLTLYLPKDTTIYCIVKQSAHVPSGTYCYISVNGDIVAQGQVDSNVSETVEYTYTVKSNANIEMSCVGQIFGSADTIEITEY